MLEPEELEKLEKQLESQNKGLWIELIAEIHKFKTQNKEEAWFWFLIDDPSRIFGLADIYLNIVQSYAIKHSPQTQFYMGVYQHVGDKELFWGEIDSHEIKHGILNDGFGNNPIESPLPEPDHDVFTYRNP